MNELIADIIKHHGIDPQATVNNRTAFEIVEAAIMGALDEIEEALEN